MKKLAATPQTQVKLYTGGKALSHQKNLFCISAWADEYFQATNNFDWGWEALGSRSIDPTKLQVAGKQPGSDGKVWLALEDNAEPYVTVVAPGKKHYNAGPVDNSGLQEYRPAHSTRYSALTDTNLDRLNLGVGEDVELSGMPDDTNTVWGTSAGGLATGYGATNTLTAPSNAPAGSGKATVTVTVHGVPLPPVDFAVKEPSEVDLTDTYVTNLFSYSTNPPDAGAGMHLIVYMKPTDVSFYRVWMKEVGEDATNVQGYFANSYFSTAFLSHKGGPGQGKGDDPFKLNEDNSWEHGTPGRDWDTAATNPGAFPDLPWSQGQFTWNVPWNWGMSSSSLTNSMTNGWQQVFTIDASGMMTVSKFGHTVTRTINQDTGTAN